MKTTLTKNDPAGWYLAESPAGFIAALIWDGTNTHTMAKLDGTPQCTVAGFTNFRLLLEAPAEYHTIYQRGESFVEEFARNPVRDTLEIFSRHLKEHVAQLQNDRSKLAEQIEDLKAECLRHKAEAKFYETQASETAALATKHGWVPGAPLVDWLKSKLSLLEFWRNRARAQVSPVTGEPVDNSIGTQDTSDEVPGLGDGDDTWEEPDLDDRYEIASDDEEILKRVPDSPGEWHNLKTKDILRVWKSNHPDHGLEHLRGQFVFPDRCTTVRGAHIETFASQDPVWVKAVPPVDANCEATKTLRELTTAIHAVCDEAEIPAYQPKMARAHLPDPLPVRDRLTALKQKIAGDHDDRTMFCCPQCAGTYFGTSNVHLPFLQWVRKCHDQYGVGCQWEGKGKDCILKAGAAAERLSDVLAKQQAKLKAIGRIVRPVNGATLEEAVQSLVDGLKATSQEFHEYKTQVIKAAKPENPAEVIATIKALRAQRDQLREELNGETELIVGDNQPVGEVGLYWVESTGDTVMLGAESKFRRGERYRKAKCPPFPPRPPQRNPAEPPMPEQILVRPATGLNGGPFYAVKTANGYRDVLTGIEWNSTNIEVIPRAVAA